MRGQERRVGLDEQLAAGISVAASRSSRALRKLTVPERLSTHPASTHARAISAPDEKQWKITVAGAPSARSTSSTSCVGVAVVDHQRLAGPLGQVDVPARTPRAARSASAQPSSLPGQ